MAEMASVPRLERCPPGPTSPSRALVTVECGETPSGRGPQEAACRCAGWAGMLSAAQLQCYHAGHPGPGPKLVDGLPEMRPRAPRIVSGQKRAGSLPGQGGERGHKDCVHMGHKQAKAWHRGTAAEAEVIHQRDHDAAQAKAQHRGTAAEAKVIHQRDRALGNSPGIQRLAPCASAAGSGFVTQQQGGKSRTSHVAREMPSILLSNVPSRTYRILLLKFKKKKKGK